ENGPQLETAEIEAASDNVETIINEVETSNPLVENLGDKVGTNNHGASARGGVEVDNSSAEVGADVSSNNSPSSNSERSSIANNRGFEEKAGVKTNNPSNLNSQDFAIDDPWECDETPFCNLEEGKEVHSSGTEAKPSLIKLMLAVWDNIYELGKIVLNARPEDLVEAVSQLSSHQIAHIKQAATRAWYPGLNRDGDYKGERVEIWEVGQSPTVKVRTKRGAFLKVKRNDLKPWLGI
ncbi:MAG: hypothetical protein AAFR37_01390, partial [Cyanobacteria bacterium J06628_3]